MNTNTTLVPISRLAQEGSYSLSGYIADNIVLENDSIALEGNASWRASVVSVDGEIENEFWLSGEIAGSAKLDCSRCLNQAVTPIRASFQTLLRYDPTQKGLEALEENDEEIIVFGDLELDLLPFLSEAFALEIPYTVLCQDDCKGLCAECGADLNTFDPNACEKGQDCCQNRKNTSTTLGELLDRLGQ